MAIHTIEQLWSWTREELIDAVQTLEGTVDELRELEGVRLYLGEHDEEYPFDLEPAPDEYKD